MTERKKIIELAKGCGVVIFKSGEADCTFNGLKAFYHAAQADAFEQAAIKCKEIKANWNYCADAIRQLGKEMK